MIYYFPRIFNNFEYVGMVEREKRINGPFLRKIVSNHDVYKRILSKLNVKTDADATTKSDFAVPRNAATR